MCLRPKTIHHRLVQTQMVGDSNSKLHPGFFNGNFRQFGNYDQCLSVSKTLNGGEISGQYCTVSFQAFENTTKVFFKMVKNISQSRGTGKMIDWKFFLKYTKAFLGLCLPKSCSIKDMNRLWSYIQRVFRIPVEAKFLEGACVSGREQYASADDFYVFIFFGVILAILLSSTIYDLFLQSNKGQPDVFVCFSLYTNTKRLLSTRCENDSLTCLYGIRVISMAWVIIGHIAVIQMFSSNINTLYVVTEWKTSYMNTFITAAPYAVDTFFSISGLLVVYIHLKYSEKFKINLWAFYLHRVIRLVPALVATLLIYTSLYKYVSEGPLWPLIVKKLQVPCQYTWWATLLFFNNYLDFNNQCMQHTWYLSVDTQLYVIVAPIILYYMKKNPSKTLLGITLACLFSILYTFLMVVHYNLGFIPYWEMEDNDSKITYFNPLSRMPSWLVGSVLGYLLYQNKKLQNPQKINFLLWTASLLLMLGLILYHQVFMNSPHNVFRSAFFNSFSRFMWSLAVCFIIFSCSTGRGDFINNFLSHPVFIVLGKLTYSMYLTHVLIIMAVTGNQKHASYFSNFGVFCDFCSNSVIIIGCSTLMCLCFETPFISILKHLDKRKNIKHS
ncbi:nose resistant to fluoxetine protein 6 isoform X2 [Tribolium castaneum]|uniref:nose resistant to fluoxetine protein 6 isoform X2 n=1 Tax=Tribolium castaneum TaxID=7070 RepID=UPI00077D9C4E|nr:PREDICTED: nose resistant to fluoxetine protein 6-like isoform X2 [Tribolium castaneum]|eukprot:XP_015835187.1 PREDICTED: nose resistant to fluoxetine protein 6-like isoform X2 [Tribolium castaneum]